MIYRIDFWLNLCGASKDEINSVVNDLNKDCEILLNKEVKLLNKNDETYFTCKTEQRLVPKLLTEIFDRYNIERIEVVKWH